MDNKKIKGQKKIEVVQIRGLIVPTDKLYNQIINLIFMSTSLPRIKIYSENSQSKSSSLLKFKKLNLGNEGSLATIQSKKNTIKVQLKTQRMSTLQRFSSIQQQRDFRNEKIHQNLIERKLLAGRYDETVQTETDLNKLRLKIDQYRIDSKVNLDEVEKAKRSISDIKKEIQIYSTHRNTFQHQKKVAQENYQLIKKKVEAAAFQKSIFQHMILNRQSINLFLANQITFCKNQISKLQTFQSILEKETLDMSDRLKITQITYEQIKKKALVEKQQRQQILAYERQKIHRKIQNDINRFQRNKNIQQIKQKVDRQEEQKQFNQLYKKIIINKFHSQWLDAQLDRNTQKYSQLQAFFTKICSYSRISINQPQVVLKRYSQHQPESLSVQKIIKQKQQKLETLEISKKKLQIILQEVKNQSLSIGQNTFMNIISDSIEIQSLKKQMSTLMNEERQKRQKILDLKKWVYNQLILFGVKPQKRDNLEAVITNYKTLSNTILQTMNEKK